ncbi:hypothetical protein IGI04_019194 [Brassica rapa subsp. trilocularis]|uniref:Uncharacterized protein n=1 Tax=Brassica rapa subsp. trilocularis TaxID=1813537 RepID=A0ABQ7MF47_BRACM|nr:hypothetical protein IGI04_019194 [Brassica rapa subsp. trilocularis]
MLRRTALSYKLAGSGTSGASQNVSQLHHSLTNIQANNLLGTHDLNTRLRVGNSSARVFGRLAYCYTRVFINSSLTRHEFTETLILLGTSSQSIRLCLSMSQVNSSFTKHEFKANSHFTRHKFERSISSLSLRTWGTYYWGWIFILLKVH